MHFTFHFGAATKLTMFQYPPSSASLQLEHNHINKSLFFFFSLFVVPAGLIPESQDTEEELQPTAHPGLPHHFHIHIRLAKMSFLWLAG